MHVYFVIANPIVYHILWKHDFRSGEMMVQYKYEKTKQTPLSFYGQRLRKWCLDPESDPELNRIAESGQNIFDIKIIESLLKCTSLRN